MFPRMAAPVKRRSEASVSDKFRAAASGKLDPLPTAHHVFLGDARQMTHTTEPGSVHLVVTSPPYWTLKEYDAGAGDNQLGHFEGYEAFQDELAKVWQRCFDLLVPGGRMCVVVGDVCLSRKKAGRHSVIPLHTDISVRCPRLASTTSPRSSVQDRERDD
ncbi:MAG: DNA methyltransferase [Gemmatimonadales bacterium]